MNLNFKRIIATSIAIAAVPVIGLGSFLLWLRLTYYDELNYVTQQLKAIPGVEVIKAYGNEDVTLEDLWAHIDVKGKGRLELYDLSKKSFTSGTRIGLARIGDLYPRFNAFGYFSVIDQRGNAMKTEQYGSSVDLGGDSVFSKMFPPRLNTVQEVVRRYDDIHSILDKWPRCPDVAKVRDSNGNDYCYCVTYDDVNRNWPRNCGREEGSANPHISYLPRLRWFEVEYFA